MAQSLPQISSERIRQLSLILLLAAWLFRPATFSSFVVGLGLVDNSAEAEVYSVKAVEAVILEPLHDQCLVYPNGNANAKRKRDWWMYKWCPFEGEIFQYHEEQGAIQVEYSLGSLVGEGAFVSHPKSHGLALKYNYDGGQHCHETNKPRRTKVGIICCNQRYQKSYGPPYIKSVKEVRIPYDTLNFIYTPSYFYLLLDTRSR